MSLVRLKVTRKSYANSLITPLLPSCYSDNGFGLRTCVENPMIFVERKLWWKPMNVYDFARTYN